MVYALGIEADIMEPGYGKERSKYSRTPVFKSKAY
jgi:hypothetical protein